MKKSIISSLLIISILISSFSVNATEVPKESAPCYATDEAIAVVENLWAIFLQKSKPDWDMPMQEQNRM